MQQMVDLTGCDAMFGILLAGEVLWECGIWESEVYEAFSFNALVLFSLCIAKDQSPKARSDMLVGFDHESFGSRLFGLTFKPLGITVKLCVLRCGHGTGMILFPGAQCQPLP